MKRSAKLVTLLLAVVIIATLAVGLVACDKGDNDYFERTEGQIIRFSAPQGTPALAMLRLVTDNPTLDGTEMSYKVVAPAQIASEMTNGADVVIMPVNTGAKLISKGKDYKLVSVAVEGSLFMVGSKATAGAITFDDIKGKKIACIGRVGVPGLVFRYVMQSNGIEVIESGTPAANQVFVQYVAEGANAMSLMSGHQVDFAVVGEPAATQMKNKLSLNAEMDMQAEYSKVDPAVNGESYPQAGLFVRSALAKDRRFMDALFSALDASKKWVEAHPSEVEAFAKTNLYESAVFPTPSIARCAIDCGRLDSNDKNEIIAFFKNTEPKDELGKVIDWDGAKSAIFG